MAIDPLAAIRRFESGNAANPGGRNVFNYKYNLNPRMFSAGGFYQITNSTWRTYAGADVLSRYPRAIDAPYDVQSQVAGNIYSQRGFADWAPFNPTLRSYIASNGGPGNFALGGTNPFGGAPGGGGGAPGGGGATAGDDGPGATYGELEPGANPMTFDVNPSQNDRTQGTEGASGAGDLPFQGYGTDELGNPQSDYLQKYTEGYKPSSDQQLFGKSPAGKVKGSKSVPEAIDQQTKVQTATDKANTEAITKTQRETTEQTLRTQSSIFQSWVQNIETWIVRITFIILGLIAVAVALKALGVAPSIVKSAPLVPRVPRLVGA